MPRSQDFGHNQNKNSNKTGTTTNHQTTHSTGITITTTHKITKDEAKTEITVKTEITKETTNNKHTTKETTSKTEITLLDKAGETPETDLRVGKITEISARYVESRDTQQKLFPIEKVCRCPAEDTLQQTIHGRKQDVQKRI